MPGIAHDPARERDELAAYLGDAFVEGNLSRSEEVLVEEAAEVGDEAQLYRVSHAYLYDLTAFAMSGIKLPYLETLTRLLPPGARVLDYGCGIGSDGLMLMGAGFRVEFADFDNPSTRYLRWRLERRGLQAPVHDLDRGVPDGFDAAYSFDVIEHVPDAVAFLGELERRADVVAVNLLEIDKHEHELHHHLPMAELMGRVARQTLVHYRIHHGSSHLVVYRTRPATPVGRALNAGRVAAGRARRTAGMRLASLRG
jgi:2-polyprenyl-3-methyl-5-hydroxy-6-metoxy-1,4-benzoquinol methylase